MVFVMRVLLNCGQKNRFHRLCCRKSTLRLDLQNAYLEKLGVPKSAVWCGTEKGIQ